MEQTIHASGKIAVAYEKRRRQKGQVRSGTHACDLNQRGRKRKRAARISRSGLIVRGPLREFRPTVLQHAKRADKRKNVWCEKEEEALGIVARSPVGMLMAQSDVEFFSGEHTEHATRDEQPRAKQAGQSDKGSFVFDEHDRGRISLQMRFLADGSAKPIVAQGSDEGMHGSSEWMRTKWQHRKAPARRKVNRHARRWPQVRATSSWGHTGL